MLLVAAVNVELHALACVLAIRLAVQGWFEDLTNRVIVMLFAVSQAICIVCQYAVFAA